MKRASARANGTPVREDFGSRVAAVAALFAAAATALPAAEPPPPRVAIEVRAGEERLPATLLEDLEGALEAELQSRGCGLEVSTAAAADLLLGLRIDAVEVETHFDASLGEIARADHPEAGRRYAAVHGISARIEILAMPGRQTLRDRSVAIRSVKRPIHGADDAAATARADTLEQIAQQARRTLCRRQNKLLRALALARGDEPAPR